jgi:hypothetical protein
MTPVPDTDSMKFPVRCSECSFMTIRRYPPDDSTMRRTLDVRAARGGPEPVR